MNLPVDECFSDFSLSVEDTSEFRNFTYTEPSGDTFILYTLDRRYPSDGGFLIEFDLNNITQSQEKLMELVAQKFLDEKTAAIFTEFAVYNPNLNQFCLARISLEVSNSGKGNLKLFISSS